MRDLHSRMLTALLEGEGLRGIAELAAEEAGSPVAIVLPARGLSAASSEDVPLADLEIRVAGRLRGDDPGSEGEIDVDAVAEVEAGGETIGYALALGVRGNGLPRVRVDREEVLRTAALAAIAEVAVAGARDEVAADVRGSLLEDLRARRPDAADAVGRAARLGSDLTAGAIALVAQLDSSRPRHAAALITGEHPGAIAEPLAANPGEGATRIYAILPALRGGDGGERTTASAKAIVSRLRSHGPAAFSSFCADPADLGRAIAEAELMLDVITRDERLGERIGDEIGNGVYRLLFRAMASDPEEVHRFYAETVEPLVAHDRQYRTDLIGTLETYLANDCNMNATARSVYAHRHTVAHRLGRIRELTGLDPGLGDDRERLGLGLKAYRIVAPTLPK